MAPTDHRWPRASAPAFALSGTSARLEDIRGTKCRSDSRNARVRPPEAVCTVFRCSVRSTPMISSKFSEVRRAASPSVRRTPTTHTAPAGPRQSGVARAAAQGAARDQGERGLLPEPQDECDRSLPRRFLVHEHAVTTSGGAVQPVPPKPTECTPDDFSLEAMRKLEAEGARLLASGGRRTGPGRRGRACMRVDHGMSSIRRAGPQSP